MLLASSATQSETETSQNRRNSGRAGHLVVSHLALVPVQIEGSRHRQFSDASGVLTAMGVLMGSVQLRCSRCAMSICWIISAV